VAVTPEKIEVNKCYRTSTGEVRRVTDVSNDEITFEVRGRHMRFPWNRHPRQSRRAFASQVVEEVTSHSDPVLGGTKT
jgi:hypothetical protein